MLLVRELMNDIFQLNAKELLSGKRIDIAAKYTYAEHLDKGYDMTWATELYTKHIEAFSGGTYSEDNKRTAKDFLDSFDLLCESIKENGYKDDSEPTLISDELFSINGAHRTAACLYHDKMMNCRYYDKPSKYTYNASFFKSMFLDEKYIDYMVTKYVELKESGVYVICIWPKGYVLTEKLKKACEHIYSEAEVVYEKDIQITYNGLKNFMLQVYFDHEWVGNVQNGFKGVEGKCDPCFSKDGKLKVFIVEKKHDRQELDITKLKREIRDIFDIENHSVHSNDTKEEAIRMVHLLLNNNSVNLLNHGNLTYDKACLSRILEFQSILSNAKRDKSLYIIDSSTIMGLYGMRNVRDLDYISIDDFVPKKKEFADKHNSYVKYYGMSETALIMNPCNYAYIFDMKIVTPSVLMDFKKNRGEEKDREDCKLIEKALSSEKSFARDFQVMIINSKRFARNFRSAVRDFLQKHNIYFFTKAWHFIRGKGFK